MVRFKFSVYYLINYIFISSPVNTTTRATTSRDIRVTPGHMLIILTSFGTSCLLSEPIDHTILFKTAPWKNFDGGAEAEEKPVNEGKKRNNDI